MTKYIRLKDNPNYNIDIDINSSNCIYLLDIDLHFYQLWYLFGEMPCIYKGGKSGKLSSNMNFYEWKIVEKDKTHNNSDIILFTIYSWDTLHFTKIKKWYIGTNTQDNIKIKYFLDTILKSLQYYKMHFRCIEKHIFESNDSELNLVLKTIKKELFTNKNKLTLTTTTSKKN